MAKRLPEAVFDLRGAGIDDPVPRNDFDTAALLGMGGWGWG